VNGRGYTFPGTHGNALRHCFQLVPGIYMCPKSADPHVRILPVARSSSNQHVLSPGTSFYATLKSFFKI